MSKTKCLMIIIISAILIGAEALAFFIFVKPSMVMDDFYKAVESGDPDKMMDVYDKLSDDDRDDAVKALEDKAVSITNDYLKAPGTGISYDDWNKKMWPMVKMSGEIQNESESRATELTNILNKCYYHANGVFLWKQFDKTVEAKKANDMKKAEDAANDYGRARRYEFGDNGTERSRILAYKNIDYAYRDELDKKLGEYLEEKYKLFADGKLDKASMDAYISVAKNLFYGDAKDSYDKISEEYSAVGDFDTFINEQTELCNNGEYLKAVKNIDSFMKEKKDEELFKTYEDSFKTLRNKAYEDGKKAYPDILYDLLKDGKPDEAQDILKEIDEVYGKDIDLKAVKSFLKNDWKSAYYSFMLNWEENLDGCLDTNTAVGEFNYSLDINLTSNKPDLVTLKDLDGEGTPELILHNSRKGYSYILTCIDGQLVFSGCLKVISYGKDTRYIIAEPYSGSAGAAAFKRELCSFNAKDGSISLDRVIYRNRDYSYVNIDGVEYTKDNESGNGGVSPAEMFDKTLNEIEDIGNGNGSDPDPSGSVTVSRYFEYIYNFGSAE